MSWLSFAAMKLAMIGKGAIARYVMSGLSARGHHLGAVIVRTGTGSAGVPEVASAADVPDDTDIVIDCAGHQALAAHGPEILTRGIDMITVSIGALANPKTADALENAAKTGHSKLFLASGAIGALDCLSAARAGKLASVTYTSRKPPVGWKGSPAEHKLNLDNMTGGPETHFEGTAREAALSYPKNANVSAAVALAGLGFDDTRVRLIADPATEQNVHEVEASGDFGTFRFQISGNALPDNPRSSALAAMSILAKLDQIAARVSL